MVVFVPEISRGGDEDEEREGGGEGAREVEPYCSPAPCEGKKGY